MAVNTGRTGRSPGRPRRQVEAPEGGRELILDAAARVFGERGYRGATVDAILAEAGLSKGAFYWHFESKDELFLALMSERVERPMQEMIELLRSGPPEQDMSEEATRRFEEFLEGGREAILLEHDYEAVAARDPRLRRRYARHRAELRSALAEALAARAHRLGAPPFDIPAEEVAIAFLALIGGLARERLFDSERVPGRLLGDMTGLIYLGLVTRAERDK